MYGTDRLISIFSKYGTYKYEKVTQVNFIEINCVAFIVFIKYIGMILFI